MALLLTLSTACDINARRFSEASSAKPAWRCAPGQRLVAANLGSPLACVFQAFGVSECVQSCFGVLQVPRNFTKAGHSFLRGMGYVLLSVRSFVYGLGA